MQRLGWKVCRKAGSLLTLFWDYGLVEFDRLITRRMAGKVHVPGTTGAIFSRSRSTLWWMGLYIFDTGTRFLSQVQHSRESRHKLTYSLHSKDTSILQSSFLTQTKTSNEISPRQKVNAASAIASTPVLSVG